MAAWVFIGLGNPGSRYEGTRHNLGSLVVQGLADRLQWSLKEDHRFTARRASGVVGGRNLHLLLPLTYMNLSGSSVVRYLAYFKLDVSEAVVVVDDVALPFGRMRLRAGGSAGGHNGLKSIEVLLGTPDYKRLRMGVGHPGQKPLVDYVLEPFNEEEGQGLPSFVDRGIEALQQLLNESFPRVMTRVNGS